MTLSPALLSEFDAIDAYLKAVREIVHNGHLPDMKGLDARISDLCAAVEQAAPEIQQHCLLKLDDLLKKLDICESDMRAFRDAQIKQSGGHS